MGLYFAPERSKIMKINVLY